MRIRLLANTIFSVQTAREFGVAFLASFGALSGAAEAFKLFFPDALQYGGKGFATLLCLSLVIAIIMARPKLSFKKFFPVPDMHIGVSVGDIFEEEGNLVIGSNDVFDTEIGAIVSVNSMQGKFLNQIYQSNRAELDRDIQSALEGIEGATDPQKAVGKNVRYPLGTAIMLRRDGKKYFWSAYGRMEADLTTSSSTDTLWQSLGQLWDVIRLKGECESIAMPVIGTNLARVGESHSIIIKMILLSFVMASRKKVITKDFHLVIHPSNMGKVNLKEIETFLRNL